MLLENLIGNPTRDRFSHPAAYPDACHQFFCCPDYVVEALDDVCVLCAGGCVRNPDLILDNFIQIPGRCVCCGSQTDLRQQLYLETICPNSPSAPRPRRWLALVICIHCLANPQKCQELEHLKSTPDFIFELGFQLSKYEAAKRPEVLRG